LSLYEGRGDYQLIVSSMQPVGEGALQAAFFQMKERLAAEGLFDEAHKQQIPSNIKTVGIVTSATGAALHDILTVLNRRFPAINVVLYPSQVQGNEATATIVQAIEIANQRKEVDVLVVGRGGGSLEDLWCFNTEPVARAIYASALPIISAVGHEVDVSISDFVADVRAATPSQAAEMVSPDQFELMQKLDLKERRLTSAILNQLTKSQLSVTNLRKRLKNPADLVSLWKDKLDTVEARLRLAMHRPIAVKQEQLANLKHRLQRVSPSYQISQDRIQLTQLNNRLKKSIQAVINPKRSQFQKLVATLNVLSPLSTLDRGYSITRDSNGVVIQRASQLQPGEEIETLLKEGRIVAKVSQVFANKSKD